jgi:hypothetical protein
MKNNLYGYSGKQLRVSSNDGKILKKKIDYNKLKNYLGGVGYATFKPPLSLLTLRKRPRPLLLSR